ncbi:thiopeptide-type bacteriocin biosynthesis protein [Nocardiopsis sp. NRRL B-16309]|uniref:thiopeptide-type bacteriocin biosynthesis protein n=1 Tax=Nocardiopsis sp. NRRL B-16309 TaxID=1519494 RepID=UPI0006B0140F|nr:thiopeptide-type bacteriocin biosynthesis protein [Nocardiopsis sp. NRRL B-16309]KOX23808.1 hypothetical protein ADL05_01750 [Nocardiopsis sp. NRRL B-16309]
MSADRLTHQVSNVETAHPAVLAVLGGAPPADTATRFNVDQVELEADIALFCRAGHQALAAREQWWQVHLEFDDWHRADQVMGEYFLPALQHLEPGSDPAWWYIRKHPCWRVRLRIPEGQRRMRAEIGRALDDLTRAGHLRRWWTGCYEPETIAFGGSQGMDVAHALFTADSHFVLTVPEQDHAALGRRELSVLLCSALLRGAGLEWYEQGDVWHRVAEERPLPEDVVPEWLGAMADDIRALLQADTSVDGPLFGRGEAAHAAAPWAGAFHTAGHSLKEASRDGALERGIRRVLAYHVIFHWNRLGLAWRTQTALAWAARTAILDGPQGAVLVH